MAEHEKRFIPPTLTPVVLAEDVVCTSCGYNLRGLDRDCRCPECGVAIAPSLARKRQIVADSHWVRTVRAALILMLLAMAFSVLASALLATGDRVATFFLWSAHLLAALSAWLIAISEPNQTPITWIGELLRGGAVGVTVAPLFLLSCASASSTRGGDIWIDAACSLSMLASCFVTWLYYERLRQIASRFRYGTLELLAQFSGWALSMSSFLMIVLLPDRAGMSGSNAYSIGIAPVIGAGCSGWSALLRGTGAAAIVSDNRLLVLIAPPVSLLLGVVTIVLLYMRLGTTGARAEDESPAAGERAAEE